MKLELRDATIGYGSKVVLKGVDVSVESGELVCLLGPNGVGKTTLFKSILGFQRLLGGRLLLDGVDRSEVSPREFAQKVGYVPQFHSPPFPFSVVDVVVMGRTAHLKGLSTPTRADYRIAYESLEQLGVGYLANQTYTNISGGERQMALIARALTQKPSLLVMDEPTANLDYGNQVSVLRVVRNLTKGGLGVIMTTHNPDHAFLCCTKADLITKGKNLVSGHVDDVVTEGSLKGAYGVDVKIAQVFSDAGIAVKTCVPMLD